MISCNNLSIVPFYTDKSSFLVYYDVVVLLNVILIFLKIYIHITISFSPEKKLFSE